MTFQKGFRDALPIFIGYFGVGFALAASAAAKEMPAWAAPLLAATQFSGTGSGATIGLYGAQISFRGIALACLALNARYLLLSFALVRRLSPSMGLWGRLLVALGVTDENVAVAIAQKRLLSLPYLCGLYLCSYLGWNLGSVAGLFGAGLFDATSLKILGMALYGMFVAILIPAACDSRPVARCIAFSVGLQLAQSALGSPLSASARMLVSGIAAAFAGAFLFPVETKQQEKNV